MTVKEVNHQFLSALKRFIRSGLAGCACVPITVSVLEARGATKERQGHLRLGPKLLCNPS